MIDRVFYAIAQEQRYYLNGALMVLKNRKMELVSTDGHRLSYIQDGPGRAEVDKEIRVIVAKKTLSEIRKFEDETIGIRPRRKQLFFRVGPPDAHLAGSSKASSPITKRSFPRTTPHA